MKRKIVVTSTSLAVVLCFAAAHYTRKEAPPRPAGARVAASAIEAEAERTMEARLAAAPNATAPSQAQPPEPTARVEHVFHRMEASRGLVIQQRERAQGAREVLASPELLSVVERTLAEPGFAREAFGEFAAEARFYATEVVREAALAGDWRLGLRLLGKLAHPSHEMGDTAAREDLLDVANKSASDTGLEELRARSGELRQALGYRSSGWSTDLATRRDVAGAFLAGMRQGTPTLAARDLLAELLELDGES